MIKVNHGGQQFNHGADSLTMVARHVELCVFTTDSKDQYKFQIQISTIKHLLVQIFSLYDPII